MCCRADLGDLGCWGMGGGSRAEGELWEDIVRTDQIGIKLFELRVGAFYLAVNSWISRMGWSLRFRVIVTEKW